MRGTGRSGRNTSRITWRLPGTVVSVLAAGVLAACGTTVTGSAAGPAAAGHLPAVSAAATPVPPGLGGRVWDVIPTKKKVVALTFDAGGDAAGVTSILATLKQQHVPATFFLTGNFTREFPGKAKAIAAAGKRIGDHSVSHPHFPRLTDARIRKQVLDAQRTIISVTGKNPRPWFRFPYGDYTKRTISVVNSTGYVPIGWTVDTLGWEGTSGGITATKVVNRVLAKLRPGEIVLMHCGSNPKDHSTLDAKALPTMIKKLKARGYSFVTIDALRNAR